MLGEDTFSGCASDYFKQLVQSLFIHEKAGLRQASENFSNRERGCDCPLSVRELRTKADAIMASELDDPAPILLVIPMALMLTERLVAKVD